MLSHTAPRAGKMGTYCAKAELDQRLHKKCFVLSCSCACHHALPQRGATMKIDVPDHEPSVCIKRKSSTSIELTLQPYSLTQTNIIFPVEKMAEAARLALEWIMRHEIPER